MPGDTRVFWILFAYIIFGMVLSMLKLEGIWLWN